MKIDAAVFRDDTKQPSFEELELTGPQDGEVLVRLVATGVCHTDLKVAEGGIPIPRPVVLGHEGAGVVDAIGAGITKVKPGDHVVMTFASCGHCSSCLEAAPAYCHTVNHFLSQRPQGGHYLSAGGEPVHGDFFSQSSFATYAIGVERSVVKVRQDAPLEMLGPMGCGFQTGAGAILNDFKIPPGKSLAIFGVGSLGLSAVMAGRIAGAGRIVVVDRHAHRLELAKELGADDTIQAGTDPVAPDLIELTSGGVDYALDTTGVGFVMRQAFVVLAPRGVCGYVTSPVGSAEMSLPMRHFLGGRSIQGISEGGSNPDVFIPRLIDYYMDGRFPIDRLVKDYRFEQLGQAFEDSEAGLTIKPILRFESI